MMRLRTLATSSIFFISMLLTACQPAPTSTATPIPTTGLAPVNDITMYYEIHGDGTPLILLHGGMNNTRYWENQIPALSAKYRVIAVDSRGHDRSTASDQQSVTLSWPRTPSRC